MEEESRGRGGGPKPLSSRGDGRHFLLGAGVDCLQPDLLKKVGVQPRDSEQLKLSRIETSDVQPSPAVQHDRATV